MCFCLIFFLSKMSVELVFGVLGKCWHATVPRNLLIRFSTLCADMLEDVEEEDSEEQSVVLPIPFVQDPEIARLVVEFLQGKEIFLELQPPRSIFKIMMAANGMYIQKLLDKTTDEIAHRWECLSIETIRTQWGFVDNLSAEQQEQIWKENDVIFSIDKETPKEQSSQQEDDWEWPVELVRFILEKMPTSELARMRAVCVEFYDLIHCQLLPRGDFYTNMTKSLQNTTLGFAERHCIIWIRRPCDVELVLALEQSERGPRHIAIKHGVKLSTTQIISLGQLKCLERLEWKGDNDLREKGARELATFLTLKYLEIGKLNCIGAKGAAFLSNLSNLQHLEFGWWNALEEEGVKSLAALSKLEYLVIGSNNRIGVEGAKSIATLFNLKHLEIGDGDIEEEGAVALSSLFKLEYLVIGSNNNIGGNGAKAIATLENLQYLEIWDGNNIRAQGAKYLKALSKLEYLTIGCDE